MLSLRTFIGLNAGAGIAFGVVLVAAPSLLLDLYGIPAGQGAHLFARMFGAELLGLNVPCWFARENPTGGGAALCVMAHAIAETLLFAVTLGAAIAGVGNMMVWSVVAIFAFFAGGNLWFLFAAGRRAA
jgi:hypothetical protein